MAFRRSRGQSQPACRSQWPDFIRGTIGFHLLSMRRAERSRNGFLQCGHRDDSVILLPRGRVRKTGMGMDKLSLWRKEPLAKKMIAVRRICRSGALPGKWPERSLSGGIPRRGAACCAFLKEQLSGTPWRHEMGCRSRPSALVKYFTIPLPPERRRSTFPNIPLAVFLHVH